MIQNLSEQEAIGGQITEDISQIVELALGEGAVVCQVCGSELQEGASIVAYAFRPADELLFEIGHVKCADDRHVPTECFTLGVRELVVEGRIGQCTDVAMQSSWPVLLAPEPLVVSPASSTAAVPVPGVAWFRRPPEECDACRVVDGDARGESARQGHAGEVGDITVDRGDPELQERLETAITALQELTAEL